MSPLVGLIVVVPAGFAVNWLLYQIVLMPLVRRARNQGMLEVDSILATFGLLFVIQGVMLVMFGGSVQQLFTTCRCRSHILGTTLALNRMLALLFALIIGAALYLALTRTRYGTAMRAVAVDPVAAQLVAIDVRTASALAFALGGALAAAGGVLIAMFLTFNATMGVVFTMKALIVVIMGGVGNIAGRAGRRPDARPCRDRGRAAGRSRPHHRGHLRAVPRACCCGGRRACSGGRRVEPRNSALVAAAAVVIALLAAVPLVASGYHLALGISLLYFTVLATAWALFSGPTHYISLATVAFFGIGAYTIAVLAEILPWPVVLAAAGRGRRRGRADRRPLDAAPVGHLFRHLHLRPGRADPPARRPGTRSTSTARSAATSSLDITPEQHLLAAAGARRRWCSSPAG